MIVLYFKDFKDKESIKQNFNVYSLTPPADPSSGWLSLSLYLGLTTHCSGGSNWCVSFRGQISRGGQTNESKGVAWPKTIKKVFSEHHHFIIWLQPNNLQKAQKKQRRQRSIIVKGSVDDDCDDDDDDMEEIFESFYGRLEAGGK